MKNPSATILLLSCYKPEPENPSPGPRHLWLYEGTRFQIHDRIAREYYYHLEQDPELSYEQYYKSILIFDVGAMPKEVALNIVHAAQECYTVVLYRHFISYYSFLADLDSQEKDCYDELMDYTYGEFRERSDA